MRLAARVSYFSEFRETANDFRNAIFRLPLALNLAVQDILSRYRGSVLGPWWITITMGSLILGIGINYAALFHQPVQELLPYVALGLVTWGFISTCLSEGGEAFVAGGAMLRQSALPLPLFIFRCIIRNFISLAHQIIIIVAVLVWFKIFPGLGILYVIPGLLFAAINIGWASLMLAMISARFRDVPQIVSSTLQFVFFLSPIFWKPSGELEKSPLVSSNPFYFSIQAIREPVLHGVLPANYFMSLVALAVVGWIATILFYNQTRRRVVHYL